MNKTPFAITVYHFPGTYVLVPTQKNGKEIIAENKGFLHTHYKRKTTKFESIRRIANIVFYEKGTKNPVTTFDPPIEIRVNYTLNIIKKSKKRKKPLQLAYWDGSDWVIISDEAHQYVIYPSKFRHIAEAKIWSWVGDPPVAWGT